MEIVAKMSTGQRGAKALTVCRQVSPSGLGRESGMPKIGRQKVDVQQAAIPSRKASATRSQSVCVMEGANGRAMEH